MATSKYIFVIYIKMHIFKLFFVNHYNIFNKIIAAGRNIYKIWIIVNTNIWLVQIFLIS